MRKRGELPLIELYQTFQVKSAAEFVLELRNIAEKVKLKIIIKPSLVPEKGIRSIKLLSPDDSEAQLTFNITDKELLVKISELGMWSLLIIE